MFLYSGGVNKNTNPDTNRKQTVETEEPWADPSRPWHKGSEILAVEIIIGGRRSRSEWIRRETLYLEPKFGPKPTVEVLKIRTPRTPLGVWGAACSRGQLNCKMSSLV